MLLGWEDTPIEVIPAVDVLGTGAVRLRQGDYDDVVEQPGDPVALARAFAAAGAGRIHLVDLDGARSGRVRPELVREVAAVVAPARVQASGGIRSPADARSLLAAGAERVVVGTAAFPDPAPWAAELGDRLVVALDVRDGRIRTAGWTQAGLPLDDALARCRGPASSASSAPRSTATGRSRDRTWRSSRPSRRPATRCSPRAASARRPTSPRSRARAPKRPWSAARYSPATSRRRKTR